MPINIADFPEALALPVRLTLHSAWLLHTPLAGVLVRLLAPRTFVELGVHRGDSYAAFCEAVLGSGAGTRCTGVDTWAGDAHAGAYGPAILADLRAFHDGRYAAFSTLLQMTFDAALGQFADGSIDLLHIDGLHTYEAVKHDFESWLPKMSERGVVLFHDTTETKGDFGVWKLWAEVAPRYLSFNVPYGHGLGMLAVGDRVPGVFLELLAEVNATPDKTLAPLAALGVRNDVFLRSIVSADALHTCQDICNQWRQHTGQAIRNPTPNENLARDAPAAFAPGVTADVAQLAKDAVALLREVTALRERAGRGA